MQSERDEILRDLLGQSSDGKLVMGAGGALVFRNLALETLLGDQSLESLGHDFDGQHADGSPAEVHFARENGQPVFLEIRAAAIEWAGRPARLFTLRDISDLRAAEAQVRNLNRALKDGEDRFRSALHHAPVATIIHAEDGDIIAINEAWTTFSGYTLADIPTFKDWARMAYGEKAPEAEMAFKRDYEAYVPTVPGEYAVRTKSGEARYWYFSSAPLGRLSDGGRTMISMAMDITEQRATQIRLRESEDQVVQLQKMESIGRLAGGIAHDFNNVLQAIGGYAEFALDALDALDTESELREDIESIRRLLDRAARLTQQLLAFSRGQTLQTEALDLNELAADAIALLRRVIGEDIALDFVPAESAAAVHADPGQLYQVIVNLVVNSRDAMPRGGAITIQTGVEVFDEGSPGPEGGVPPGAYAVLAVTDTGTGMDEETKAAIFEPFFTTKASHEGAGLGLSTVYGIVKQHRGEIAVDSAPCQGATITIYLPHAHPVEEGGAARESTLPAVEAPGITVLVAEDDDAMRYVVRRYLSKAGYDVLEAKDGEEALDVAARHDGEIALLLADMIMPGLSGGELYKELARAIPGLRVLYMSGYTDEAILRRGPLDSTAPFIRKPFPSEKLIATVRDALGRDGLPTRGG